MDLARIIKGYSSEYFGSGDPVHQCIEKAHALLTSGSAAQALEATDLALKTIQQRQAQSFVLHLVNAQARITRGCELKSAGKNSLANRQFASARIAIKRARAAVQAAGKRINAAEARTCVAGIADLLKSVSAAKATA